MSRQRDELFASPLDQMVDFRFDERVVNVFPDMIQRSVPGYATLISAIGILAARHAQPDSHCYDLGCSLGAVSLSMRQRIRQPGCDIIAVDNSAAMIDRARQVLAVDAGGQVPVRLICADIADIVIADASVVVMNFTLQFIPLARRQLLIDRIHAGLRPGGVLILSEKLAFSPSTLNDFHIGAHLDFKRDNGYSELEISQKRSALEKVLLPETLEAHRARLEHAGFGFVEPWFQCFNFASLVAVK